ncbi:MULTISPECIES: cation:proton antiporter [unclassified Sphingomonas]|uniref:cation:proton antiporter n=1 Tax=unclassified Sphingomonas TaxID=196159 RepID=UPI000A476A74|nr:MULTISPECIES: cation:proton antiporter [unclassified Sphingomonas]
MIAAPPAIVELYIPVLLGLGLLILLVAWLPLVLKEWPLSLPIVCVGIGAGLFSIPRFQPFAIHPIETPFMVEKAAELIVLVSLMGAGLKIARPLSWRGWRPCWRMLGIAMPLTIVALTLLGAGLLGVGLSTALLLAASLAPTDPVLASDVQIEKPGSDSDDEARFTLTSEAGLNDALAFPFVHLAIAAAAGGWTWATMGWWVLDDVVFRLAVGAIAGVAGGWLLGWIVYRLPGETRLSRTGDGFVALGATLVIYALTELAHGYGFLAVFIAGLMLNRAAATDVFNDRLHDFADETERLLMMVMLVMFGGMLSAGGLLALVRWSDVVFALIAVFLVRPLVGWISLAGLRRSPLERGAIAFFGIRGLGSVFYFAYGINHGQFDQPTRLWGAIALVILISILLHGTTVTPVMRRLDRQREVEA